jgi:uncharacterized protein (DUF2141 family)
MHKFYGILLGVFMLFTSPTFATERFTTELNITVTNIDTSQGGNIVVMIFGEEGFPKNHALALLTATKKVLSNTMVFTFLINQPEVSIKVLHDENGDGKVTKNWTGIYPKDSLGFSNDQKIGLTGPPNYLKSKIRFVAPKSEATISIIY